jgi:hypothetical protein
MLCREQQERVHRDERGLEGLRQATELFCPASQPPCSFCRPPTQHACHSRCHGHHQSRSQGSAYARYKAWIGASQRDHPISWPYQHPAPNHGFLVALLSALRSAARRSCTLVPIVTAVERRPTTAVVRAPPPPPSHIIRRVPQQTEALKPSPPPQSSDPSCFLRVPSARPACPRLCLSPMWPAGHI